MELGILGWQLLILITIVVAGRSRGIAVIFWVIWTAVQVFALPLSILQFGTIWLGHAIASALFPHPPSTTARTVPTPPVAKASDQAEVKPVRAKVALKAAPSRVVPSQVKTTLPVAVSKPHLNSGQILAAIPNAEGGVGTRWTMEPVKGAVDLSREEFLRRLQLLRSSSVQHSPMSVGRRDLQIGVDGSPPDYDDLSPGLVAYLESLSGISSAPDVAKVPRVGMCVVCADEHVGSVAGMRYCTDCGAFQGMVN